MWKFQIGMSALLCVVGLIILATVEPTYSNRSLYTGGQTLAILGGIFVVMFAIRRYFFGYTGD
jgi:drug/metabolite transporter superfamily protein YnfA